MVVGGGSVTASFFPDVFVGGATVVWVRGCGAGSDEGEVVRGFGGLEEGFGLGG